MESVKIGLEQLEKLRKTYPHIASCGDSVLVRYTLSRFLYQLEIEANRPQLPSFLER